MKKLDVVMTSNLKDQIDPELICSILVQLIPLFRKYLYDMYVIEPDEKGRLQIRIAGYSFITNELDEGTIISRTEMAGEKVIWFKVDDYQDRYVGTLLLPEDY
ncbi:MAG: hypothetical protein P9L97_13010 [Candidatus Tenebribacter davisii]|nr:hypothetical protein [Candidatus Tenebribacter davisii]